MRRDWDCIRSLLLALEDLGATTSMLHAGDVPGFAAETVAYQMRLLIQAGLIEGKCSEAIGEPLDCWATAMTRTGHELLDHIRSASLWNKIKAGARERGLTLSFDVVKLLAAAAIKGLVG